MNDEFALVWKNFQELVDTFLALLPNLELASIVFLIFSMMPGLSNKW